MKKTGNKVRFEWDETKNLINQAKHKVSFYEAQCAFLDVNRIILEDIKHSTNEKRYYCLGIVNDLVMTVRFTYRKKIIRIIGAGYWRKGRDIYEEKNRKTS